MAMERSGERRHPGDLEARIVSVVIGPRGNRGPWVAELLGYIALRVAIARGAGDLVPPQGRSPDDRAAALCNSRSQSVAVSPQMMQTSEMYDLDLDQFHPDKIQLITLTNNHRSGVIFTLGAYYPWSGL